MRKLIRDLRGEHTVLLSSHILSEMSQTCDRLLVIDEGKLVASGTEAELSRGSSAAPSTSKSAATRDKAKAALARRRRACAASSAVSGATQLRVQAAPELRPALVRALVGANVDVLRIDRARFAAGVDLHAADADEVQA